ncbi:FabD/lysophospholipase-like protein [Clathrospora elynae]|uniref:FabD/lysophospholipase-like protein n=1 Tax=Clathrospora elynae TaxID=706981 RepID=A0A6A5SR58_9PLEO|nr:FabD/lysophospholipase-like protein [Clathrospora elynae]
MSWTPVDFSCVRYSPVEGTHYFYDPAFPSSIQFLLSGRWEPWDVSYVKYKAQDSDIRRVAEEAETRLVQHPHLGYVQWPSPPPSGPLSGPSPVPVNDPPQPSGDYPHPSPPVDLAPLAPSLGHGQHAQPSIPASPQDQGSHLSVEPHATSYASSNGLHPSSHDGSEQMPVVTTPTAQTASLDNANANYSTGLKPHATHGPALQPATGAILSRTRETKILLSIDGDGIRGLSALLVVESLVNAICVKVGQRLDSHQIFDLTGGSSLGGVIAIMLCRLRMQAHRAREAYKQIARQVYLNKRDYFISLDPHAQTPNIDGMALENEIKAAIKQELGSPHELLLDGRPESGDVFAVTSHIEIGVNKAALMRSYQTRRITAPELDSNMPIWQVMKATSVAPRYMLPVPGATPRLVIEPGLVDHGTAKNNPVRDILYECRKLFRYANDMVIIVSVGTGIGLDRSSEIAEMANSVEDRQAQARVWADRFEQENLALIERGWLKYFRFNVPGLEDVPLEEWCHEDLIKEKTSAYLAQPEIGKRFYACVDAITALLLAPPR